MIRWSPPPPPIETTTLTPALCATATIRSMSASVSPSIEKCISLSAVHTPAHFGGSAKARCSSVIFPKVMCCDSSVYAVFFPANRYAIRCDAGLLDFPTPGACAVETLPACALGAAAACGCSAGAAAAGGCCMVCGAQPVKTPARASETQPRPAPRTPPVARRGNRAKKLIAVHSHLSWEEALRSPLPKLSLVSLKKTQYRTASPQCATHAFTNRANAWPEERTPCESASKKPIRNSHLRVAGASPVDSRG